MANIISLFPVTTPIVEIDLSGNLLTRVPSNLTQFPQIKTVSLASNNITSLASGDLSFKQNTFKLFLNVSNNQITSIAPNAFPG
jgi:Leucine-rich repeat (LRR) protein